MIEPTLCESEKQEEVIHLEGVTLRQLRSPEGLKEARAVFRRNLDTLRRTSVLSEKEYRESVLFLQESADRSPCTSLPKSKP